MAKTIGEITDNLKEGFKASLRQSEGRVYEVRIGFVDAEDNHHTAIYNLGDNSFASAFSPETEDDSPYVPHDWIAEFQYADQMCLELAEAVKEAQSDEEE